mmetsp:Transcript_18248/g.21065  ORF Transcript_18248/g.21065 Transcript_18248/m.21065 type:complete len:196 (-) Transcript_18248:57-644(-)
MDVKSSTQYKISKWSLPTLIVVFFAQDIGITEGFVFELPRSATTASRLPISLTAPLPQRRCITINNILLRRALKTRLLVSSSKRDEEDNYVTRRIAEEKNYKKKVIDVINSILKDSRCSYKNVEKNTYMLLSKQPVIAFAIFIGMGLIVAYMLGFFFLGGYITSGNPYENGAIPYWEEDICEICKTALQETATTN